MQMMQIELRKNEDQRHQMLKQLSRFEMEALDAKDDNEVLMRRISDMDVKVFNLEKDLQSERQMRDSDKENYRILFERYKTLLNQQKDLAQKFEDSDLTEKTLREEEMIMRLKTEILENDNIAIKANLELNNQ